MVLCALIIKHIRIATPDPVKILAGCWASNKYSFFTWTEKCLSYKLSEQLQHFQIDRSLTCQTGLGVTRPVHIQDSSPVSALIARHVKI